MKLRRWEYGISVIDPKNGGPGPVQPVSDEDAARELVADSYPWVVLYRRPKPRPWRIVPLVLVAAVLVSASPADAKTQPAHVLGAIKIHKSLAGPSWTPTEVDIYGHSFTMGPDSLTGPYPYSGYSYGSLIGAHYGITKDYNGKSATRLLDTVRAVTAPTFDGSTARLWAVGNGNASHIVTLENGQNDEASELGDDADYQAGYTGALRLTLAAFGAASRTNAAAASYMSPGSWSSTSYPDRAPAGALYWTKTYGAKIEFPTTSTDVTIGTVGSDPTLTYATMRIEVDGTTVGYWNGTGQSETYTDVLGSVRSWTNAGIHLTLTAGAHTVTLRKVTNDTTSPIFVSAIYQQSATPPHVFLGMEPLRNPASDPATAANFAANDPTYRGFYAAACAEWSYVHCVDLNAASASAPTWDNTTMVATNAPTCPSVDCGKIADPYNLHPNSVGMVNLATKFEDAIDAT